MHRYFPSRGQPMSDNSAVSIVTPPLATTREERLHALDNLRAVAMLLGIVLHAGISFMTLDFGWAARDVSLHWTFDLMVGLIHGFRMQLFFFLAGFFARLLHERLGTKAFAKQRFKRIGLPFALGMITLVPLVGLAWWWATRQMKERVETLFQTEGNLASIPTGHLWFLEYLLVLYALALVVVCLAKRLPENFFSTGDRVFDWLMRSPLKALVLVPLTVLCLWNGPMWGEVEQSGVGLFPKLRAVGYYGLFFAVGWWLHRRRHQLIELPRFLKSSLALAGVAIFIHGTIIISSPKPAQPDYFTLKIASLGCAALYAWLMTFAVTGWFLRFAGQHQPWVRYLADASYWCYLVHLPLVLWLQVLAAKWPVNGWLKFSGIVLVTMTLLLASYHWCVRHTWIGRMLNGPREKPKAV